MGFDYHRAGLEFPCYHSLPGSRLERNGFAGIAVAGHFVRRVVELPRRFECTFVAFDPRTIVTPLSDSIRSATLAPAVYRDSVVTSKGSATLARRSRCERWWALVSLGRPGRLPERPGIRP